VGTMTADEARHANLSTGDVAELLGVSQDTVTRIPKDRLDHWVTPGRHRRYRRLDVEQYARDVLGLEIDSDREGEASS
jgi:excisionase family DNA binding protein